MKALVTGANGFVGSHLVRALLAAGHEVEALVRRTANLSQLDPAQVRLVYGDIRDRTSNGLRVAVEQADVVFHVAGLTSTYRPAEFLAVNAQGSENVARACAARSSPPVLVHVSSLAAAGPSTFDRLRTEADPVAPVSNYGRSKLAGERAVSRFADRMPITIVRPPIVCGFGDPNLLSFVQMVSRRGMHIVPGRPAGRYSLLHVTDLAQGLIVAAERGNRLKSSPEDPSQPGIYFLAADDHPAYDELGRMIATAIGRDGVRIVYAPHWLTWSAAAVAQSWGQLTRTKGLVNLDKMREARAGSWTCDPTRAKAELGFRVEAPLSLRLRELADRFRQANLL
jgi:nucleoside-diphosphate-sugar epimerase